MFIFSLKSKLLSSRKAMTPRHSHAACGRLRTPLGRFICTFLYFRSINLKQYDQNLTLVLYSVKLSVKVGFSFFAKYGTFLRFKKIMMKSVGSFMRWIDVFIRNYNQFCPMVHLHLPRCEISQKNRILSV